MSAFITLAREDCIEIAIDGALYATDGRLMGVKKKAIALPEIPAAIFGRGADDIVGSLSHLVAISSPMIEMTGGSNTFNDLVKRLERDYAPRVRDAVESVGGIPDEAQSEIAVAGFSETAGPLVAVMRTFSHCMENDEGQSDEYKPWTLYRLPAFWAAGPLIADEVEAMGLKWEDLGRDGLRTHALSLMTAMRNRKDVNPVVQGDTPRYGIGGHLQFVTVTRDNARSEILHIWDDVVGEMIDPFRTAA